MPQSCRMRQGALYRTTSVVLIALTTHRPYQSPFIRPLRSMRPIFITKKGGEYRRKSDEICKSTAAENSLAFGRLGFLWVCGCFGCLGALPPLTAALRRLASHTHDGVKLSSSLGQGRVKAVEFKCNMLSINSKRSISPSFSQAKSSLSIQSRVGNQSQPTQPSSLPLAPGLLY